MVRIKLHLSVAFFLAATAFPPVQIQVVARPVQDHSNPPSGHRNPPSGLSVHRPNTLAELPSWNPPQLTRSVFLSIHSMIIFDFVQARVQGEIRSQT